MSLAQVARWYIHLQADQAFTLIQKQFAYRDGRGHSLKPGSVTGFRLAGTGVGTRWILKRDNAKIPTHVEDMLDIQNTM